MTYTRTPEQPVAEDSSRLAPTIVTPDSGNRPRSELQTSPEWTDEKSTFMRRRPRAEPTDNEHLDDAELKAIATLIATTIAGAG